MNFQGEAKIKGKADETSTPTKSPLCLLFNCLSSVPPSNPNPRKILRTLTSPSIFITLPNHIKMSEPIPESIPTSADPRSKRPLKKRALTPVSSQAASLEALFAKPDQTIALPSTSLSKANTHGQPPEIVANVQGSSAGAGSGEFHVYKASRRREYERLRAMDEEVKKETEAEIWEREKKEREERDREKTRKNREKREKLKNKKGKKAGKGEAIVESASEGKKMSGIKARVDVGGTRTGVKGPEQRHDGDEKINGAEEVGIVIHDDD
jgi:hypothetical protein